MDFLQLECFLSVVKSKSFTEAANDISLSQSSISKHIMRLEKELGVKLLNRNTRTVSLTVAGKDFLEHAERLMEEYHLALRNIHTYRDLYSLHVGSVDHLGKVGVTAPIAAFLEKFPHINITLEQDNTLRLMNLLLGCKVDVALIALIKYPFSEKTNISEFPLEEYEIHTLVEDEYYLAVNEDHRLAGRSRVPWSELNGEKLVILDNSFSSNAVIQDTLKRTGTHAKVAFEAQQVDTILGLINENFGISILSRRVVTESPHICAVSMEVPIERNTAIIAPKRELRSQVCSRFVDHILEFYQLNGI